MQIDRLKKCIIGILILALIALAPTFLPNRWQHIFIMWAAWSTVGMGWLLLLRVGEFSAGQAVFLCIGGYSASVLMLKLSCPFWFSLMVGACLCGIIALLFGFIILRLGGLYFLVTSFVFSEIVRLTIAATDYLGASEGLWDIPVPGNIGFISFSSKRGWFYLFSLIIVVAYLIHGRVEKSRIGRVYTYIGTSPNLAQSFGIHVMKYKVQSFVISAIFTGLVGGATAIYFGAISPEGYTFYFSLVAQIVAILGGVGSLVWGPLLGSLLYTIFDEYLVYIPGARSLIMGMLLIVVIFFLPKGLISLRRHFLKKIKDGKFH
ncbi:MAG: branched-chain amino acid ABC transporter permease [Deltaproteobacteria bacterium]